MERLIFFYAMWVIAGTFMYLIKYGDCDGALQYYGPVYKYLYEKTWMNIVGCLICALFYYICYPLLFIPGKIGTLIFFLFHIGRR